VDQILVPLIQPMRLPAGTGRPGPARPAANCPAQQLKNAEREAPAVLANLAACTDPDLSKNGKLVNPR
jgi:hypothetical protein